MQAPTRISDWSRRVEVIVGGGRQGDEIHGVEASSLRTLYIGIRDSGQPIYVYSFAYR